MEESMIPSLSAGVVGSRFVTQDEVDTAKARRDEQWKAAYARLGQEPPPQQQDDSYDGRSLAEKLAANRIAKQEEWEEKTKLANQFRALEEDEIMFLDSIREKQEAEERQRKEMDGEELKNFKEAVAARTITTNPPPVIPGQATKPQASAAPKPPPPTAKKDLKKALKGVVVKKKPKAVASTSKASGEKATGKKVESNGSAAGENGTDKKREAAESKEDAGEDSAPNAKRRKVSTSS